MWYVMYRYFQFVDDVMFPYNGENRPESKMTCIDQLARWRHQSNVVCSRSPGGDTWGEVCHLRLHLAGHESNTLFCSLAVLNPRVGHTTDVLSPFISVLCHSAWLFHGESCPRTDVVYPGRAWSSSSACTCHCSLHISFSRQLPCFLMVWP